MIDRIWRGWTTAENADAYEALLRDVVIPGIRARRTPGFSGIRVLRRPVADEVEFLTIMTFESLAGVRQFAGDDLEKAQVPQAAQALLVRFEDRAAHFDVRVTMGHEP